MPRTTDRLPFPYRPEVAIVAQRLAKITPNACWRRR